jgi:hypothetical protein
MAMNRTKLLASYGVTDGPDLLVASIKDAGVPSRVAIHAAGNSPTALDPQTAAELSGQLRQIGHDKLADRIELEVDRVRKYRSAT